VGHSRENGKAAEFAGQAMYAHIYWNLNACLRRRGEQTLMNTEKLQWILELNPVNLYSEIFLF